MTNDGPNDLFLRVNDFAQSTPWLHSPMVTWAKYGVVVFAVLLLVGWWYARSRESRTMAATLLAPVATVIAVAVNQPIIKAVNEARPYALHPQALVLVTKTADPSLPSDHATMAGAVAMGLFLVSWRLGLLAAGLAGLMAFARVYVGAHYPQDVVAGLLFGAAVALLVWMILRVPVTRVVERLRAGRLRPLVGYEALPAAAAP